MNEDVEGRKTGNCYQKQRQKDLQGRKTLRSEKNQMQYLKKPDVYKIAKRTRGLQRKLRSSSIPKNQEKGGHGGRVTLLRN